MKRDLIFATLAAALMATSCCGECGDDVVAKDFKFIQGQIPVAIQAVETEQARLESVGGMKEGLARQVVPASVEHHDGSLKLVGGNNWVCGFFPGTLWYTYEYTKDEAIKAEATKFTELLDAVQYRTNTHDVGFMIYCSYGNAYRLTGKQEYRDVIVQAAKSLCTRFNPDFGLLRSWDHSTDKWAYPVIIDNMMNLEMLFEVAKMTGDQSFYDIAVSHADRTMENHFRDDYSTYHVVDYGTEGKVVHKHTHQGYAHDSAWARGQTWGLYGYTFMYRYTKDKRYLDLANNIANFIFTHPNLPADLVPYWDYNDPKIPNAPRDVSAAALAASALYELAGYTPEKSAEYLSLADRIVESISNNYLTEAGGDYGFITTQSTGNLPKDSEISVPISYADYYFVEALIRKDRVAKSGSAL